MRAQMSLALTPMLFVLVAGSTSGTMPLDNETPSVVDERSEESREREEEDRTASETTEIDDEEPSGRRVRVGEEAPRSEPPDDTDDARPFASWSFMLNATYFLVPFGLVVLAGPWLLGIPALAVVALLPSTGILYSAAIWVFVFLAYWSAYWPAVAFLFGALQAIFFGVVAGNATHDAWILLATTAAALVGPLAATVAGLAVATVAATILLQITSVNAPDPRSSEGQTRFFVTLVGLAITGPLIASIAIPTAGPLAAIGVASLLTEGRAYTLE